MAIARFSQLSIAQGFPKYRSALAGNTAFIPGVFESIASTTVGAGGSSVVTFSSIPQTYTHLQVRITGRASGAERAELRFNNDSGASSYDNHRLVGSGSSVAADTRIDRSALWLASAGAIGVANTSSYATPMVIDIFDYTNTNKYKTTKSIEGNDQNGSGSFELTSGSWKSTGAINRIDLSIVTYIWAQYTTIALYGIKST